MVLDYTSVCRTQEMTPAPPRDKEQKTGMGSEENLAEWNRRKPEAQSLRSSPEGITRPESPR